MGQARLSPPHSILFISDPSASVDLPEIGPALVAATSSCVAIGTLADMDGETTVILERSVPSPEGELVFSGDIGTPGKRLAVMCSDASVAVEIAVAAERTHLRIWANHASEPDLISVEAG